MLINEKLKKNYIVCIDSDGCAMDTMNVKHLNFFGPYIVEYFGIKDKDNFLKEWNRLNLFSLSRGINRFAGLSQSLVYAKAQGEEIGDISKLQEWVQNTPSLSNQSLEEEINKHPEDSVLIKALAWSNKVNESIEQDLVGIDKPFEGVKDAISDISKVADIAIVSSANKGALDSEWQRHGLMPFVDYVYGQEIGSKAKAIKEIIGKGYEPTNILMVGDSPGDEAAAKANGVYFYPILYGEEKQSWDELHSKVLPVFLSQNYESLNSKMIELFYKHLNQEKEEESF